MIIPAEIRAEWQTTHSLSRATLTRLRQEGGPEDKGLIVHVIEALRQEQPQA